MNFVFRALGLLKKSKINIMCSHYKACLRNFDFWLFEQPKKIIEKYQIYPYSSSFARLRKFQLELITAISNKQNSDAASGWAAHPEFGCSVNPIPTRGADYAHHITACPPGFENLAASL